MEWHAPWDIRVTLDLFLGGLGVGLFLLSALLTVYDKNRYHKLAAMGAYLAPVLVGGGVLFLLSELGRPTRFISTLYNFNPQSITSWGSIVQMLFVILSLIYAWLYFKNSTSSSLFKGVMGFGSVFALLVGGYHGLLLSSLGRPLWVGGMVTALFLVSSLLGGTALMIIIKELGVSFGVPKNASSEVASATDGKGFNFSFLVCILSALQLILVVSWQVSMTHSGLEPAATYSNLMDQYRGWWIGLVLICGLILPLLGSLYSLIKDKTAEMSKGMGLALSVLIITGGFTFKHLVLIAGQIKLPFLF
ncbi:formate-dependent nitrite reductase, membrane component [Desulfitobacterium dichloroeliminans LMG P-21439]|uniref:Formate-dependent nitrite reductase, membrane component n=1 Tax=Desulfitobacterium dichloroeliminans (strain LMG P-21439 / DCA1) TaxID=871963 RepID=L0F5R7_DESDL|nr:NrfD/PsrC family molybdoenzyme membrane anchor subunit [Desulfitobacterium dichloroeliminans]AGA68497.1 formate-dependent nitrite reductase, membrane component [Desulfitobacterium dichloroeliminans LMG P-21439]